MRIDEVSTRWLRVPIEPPIADSTHVLRAIDWIIVEVRAADCSGTSLMLSFDYAPSLLRAFVDHELKRHVLGEPADDVRRVRELCLRATEYVGQTGLAMWATSAIEIALWDLLGRRLGVPASLLFGRYDRTVAAYASGGWLSYSDRQLADEIARHIARGFRGVKLKIGSADMDRDVERIRAVRAAVGPDVDVMVDANQALSLESARRLARRVADCNLRWLEEPFPRDDIENYCRLAAATEIPLAAGVREFGLEGFRRLVGARAISIVQPDLLRVGGVIGWRQAASLAETHNLRVAPHFYKEYDVHLAAAVPNLVAIECFDWLDPLLVEPLEIRDGRAVVPDRPGFGVAFRPEAIRDFEVRAA